MDDEIQELLKKIKAVSLYPIQGVVCLGIGSFTSLSLFLHIMCQVDLSLVNAVPLLRPEHYYYKCTQPAFILH